MFSFGKNIRELAIKFICFFRNMTEQPHFLASFFKGEYLGHLFSDYLCNDENTWD